MNRIKLSLYTLFLATVTFGQNNVGIGTTTPSPDAALEIRSTNQGVLVPRLTTAQRTAITTPTEGLLVYDIDVNCFYFYESTAATWQNLCNAGTTGPAGPTGATGPQGPAGPTGAPGVTGATGPQGPAGPAGTNGTNGVGVTSTVDNGNGTFTINYSDGSSFTTSNLTGPQGPAGVAGAVGPQGPAGPAGTNGTNGVGVTSTVDNGNGTFTINYSDGSSFTTSNLTGPQGPAGVAGAVGPQGPTGAAGPAGPTGAQGPAGPNNVFKYTSVGTTDATIPANATAGAFVLMPQMTITFTPVNASVMMFFTAAGTYTAAPFANHTVWFEVRVNGVSIREWDTQCGTAWNMWDIAATTPLNVNVGVPNTVEIRWAAQRAGTTNTTINNLAATATYFNRSLMILDAP